MIGKDNIYTKKIKVKLISFVFLTALVFVLSSVHLRTAAECHNSDLMAQVFNAAEANLGNIRPKTH